MFTVCIAVISSLHNTLNQLNRKKHRYIKAVVDAKLLSGRQCIWIRIHIYTFCALSPTGLAEFLCGKKNTWMHKCPYVDGYAHHHSPVSNTQVHVQLFALNSLSIIIEYLLDIVPRRLLHTLQLQRTEYLGSSNSKFDR